MSFSLILVLGLDGLVLRGAGGGGGATSDLSTCPVITVLVGGYSYHSTSIRLTFDCDSTVDDLRYDWAAALRPK